MATLAISPRVIALAVVTCAAIAAVVLFVDYSKTSADVVLVGVSAEELEEGGVRLTPAESEAVPRVSARDAESAAANKRTGAISRQTILARLSGRSDASNRLVWVVNVDPSSVAGAIGTGGVNLDDPNSETRYPAGMMMRDQYLLMFFDAETGAFIFSHELSGEWVPVPSRTDDGKPTPQATAPAKS